MASKDFNPKIIRQLSAKGVSIVGTQAIPAFIGDKYLSGIAYKMVYRDTGFLRTHPEILSMAESSWSPETHLS